MSHGLVCLRCRKYFVKYGGESQHDCACMAPVRSWNFVTPVAEDAHLFYGTPLEAKYADKGRVLDDLLGTALW